MSNSNSIDVNVGERLIAYIAVIGFHHQLGNKLEWIYPPLDPSIQSRYDWNTILPFLALPDGAHNSTEDHTYFILNERGSNNDSTGSSSNSHRLYGISQFKQVKTSDLPESALSHTDTRSSIQKSICILSNFPIFYTFKTQLSVACYCYFNQGDFTNYDMLINWYNTQNTQFKDTCIEKRNQLINNQKNNNINSGRKGKSFEEEESMVLMPETPTINYKTPIDEQLFLGNISTRKLVSHFGRSALVLYKLLMLERGIVVFCAQPVNAACDSILTLLSLFPRSFEQFISSNPSINNNYYLARDQERKRFPQNNQNNNNVDNENNDLDDYSLPLLLISNRMMIQPFITLQQMEMLVPPNQPSSSGSNINNSFKGYIIGTSNNLYLKSPPSTCHAIVDIASGEILFRDESLYRVLELTSFDRRFIDNIITVINQSENSNTYVGSDQWIRDQFEQYLLCLLSHMATLLKIEDGKTVITNLDVLAPYNEWWIRRWSSTRNFSHWKNQLFKYNPCPPPSSYPIHPSGPPSDILDNIQDKLSTSMKDLQPFTNGLSKALFGASSFLYSTSQNLINRVVEESNQLSGGQNNNNGNATSNVQRDYLVENEVEEIVKDSWVKVQENSIYAAKKTAEAVKPLVSSGKVLAKQLSSQLFQMVAPDSLSPRNNNQTTQMNKNDQDTEEINNNNNVNSNNKLKSTSSSVLENSGNSSQINNTFMMDNSSNSGTNTITTPQKSQSKSTITPSKKDNITSQAQLELLEEVDIEDIYEL